MMYYKTGDCSAESLWSDPEEMMKVPPYGYVKNGDLKMPFWATCDDPLQVPGCQLVLVKFLDGSPVAVRYKKADIVSADMCPRCYRDLDFIRKVLGPESVILHQRTHERCDYVKPLKEIRDNSTESHTRDALNVLIKEYE
ncbi:MAG: hypothetical protein IMZ61_16425 [Planctomycetes bacterium]|nr:hypothetical protein [Planctomycetota bacterium]